MKRMLHFLQVLVAVSFLSVVAYGQEKAPFIFSGRKQGTIETVQKNGTTYLNLQQTARKLGLNVELFARSKQAKLTTRGFYAILTAGINELIVNAQTVKLSAPVLIDGGDMWAPAEFFELPVLQQSLAKEIAFTNGELQVERPYDLARIDNELLAKEDRIIFNPRRQVTWSSAQPNPHTVEITFPDTGIKRVENFRLKTGHISSVSIRQDRGNTVVKTILGKQGKHWTVEEHSGKIYFRVGRENLQPIQDKPAAPAEKPVAKTPQTNAVKTTSAADEPLPAPSVTDDSEDSIPAGTPTMAVAAVPEMKPTPQTEIKPTPQTEIKPAPVAAISPVHKKMRIVIDPGHGGKDPGAVRSRTREKDLNLAVAKELYKLLQKKNFEVKITRDNDTFIPLSGRSKIANTFKADLFISVHTNSSKNKNANGFEVYFRSEKATDKEAADTAALENEAMQYEEVHYNFVDALLQSLAKNEYINESSKLAGYVRNAVYKQPGIGIAVNQNSSVRQANFYVLKGVQSPAILVEMGYISSNKDRGRLTQTAVQKKMAQGIFNGVLNYAKNEGWIN